MKRDIYGRPLYDEHHLFDWLMAHPGSRPSETVLTSEPLSIASELDIDPPFNTRVDTESLSVEQWDETQQTQWHMPPEYQNYPIVEHLLGLDLPQNRVARMCEELEEYTRRDLLPLLRYLKYLVDTMRSNGIVWGVGRGSSVASYVLYLLGVHRIDSYQWNLDWREFLRE